MSLTCCVLHHESTAITALFTIPFSFCLYYVLFSIWAMHSTLAAASCFIMLAHKVRSGWWWYGSKIFHCILLLCNRWQQWQNGMTWKCVGSKGESLNSSVRKSLHPLTFTDTCWMCMENKHTASTVRQWVGAPSSGDSNILDGHAQLSHHEIKMISINSSVWIC